MTKDREMQMEKRARQIVLASTIWFDLDELAILFGVLASDLEPHLTEWKSSGRFFSVLHEGKELFPSYAFDGEHFQPNKKLAPILAILTEKKDGWGLAYWFASANGFLGGNRPQDLLSIDSEQVCFAAADEVKGITHG